MLYIMDALKNNVIGFYNKIEVDKNKEDFFLNMGKMLKGTLDVTYMYKEA